MAGPETYEFHPTPGFAALFGQGRSPARGRRAHDVVPPGDDPFVGSWNAKLCTDGSRNVQFAVVFFDPLGKIHLHSTFIPLTIFHPDLTPGTGSGTEGDTGTSVVEVPVTLSAPSQPECVPPGGPPTAPPPRARTS